MPSLTAIFSADATPYVGAMRVAEQATKGFGDLTAGEMRKAITQIESAMAAMMAIGGSTKFYESQLKNLNAALDDYEIKTQTARQATEALALSRAKVAAGVGDESDRRAVMLGDATRTPDRAAVARGLSKRTARQLLITEYQEKIAGKALGAEEFAKKSAQSKQDALADIKNTVMFGVQGQGGAFSGINAGATQIIHSFRATFDSIASGIPINRVLLQQLPQIGQGLFLMGAKLPGLSFLMKDGAAATAKLSKELADQAVKTGILALTQQRSADSAKAAIGVTLADTAANRANVKILEQRAAASVLVAEKDKIRATAAAEAHTLDVASLGKGRFTYPLVETFTKPITLARLFGAGEKEKAAQAGAQIAQSATDAILVRIPKAAAAGTALGTAAATGAASAVPAAGAAGVAQGAAAGAGVSSTIPEAAAAGMAEGEAAAAGMLAGVPAATAAGAAEGVGFIAGLRATIASMPLLAAGLVLGSIAAITASFFIFRHRVNSLVDEMTAGVGNIFNPEYIPKWASKANILVELQKNLNEEIRRTRAEHDSVVATLDRELALTKDRISFERQLLEIQKQNAIASARTPAEKEAVEKSFDRKLRANAKSEREAEFAHKEQLAAQLPEEMKRNEAAIESVKREPGFLTQKEEEIKAEQVSHDVKNSVPHIGMPLEEYKQQEIEGAKDKRPFKRDEDLQTLSEAGIDRNFKGTDADLKRRIAAKNIERSKEAETGGGFATITSTDEEALSKIRLAQQRIVSADIAEKQKKQFDDSAKDRERQRDRLKELDEKQVKAQERLTQLTGLPPEGTPVKDEDIIASRQRDQELRGRSLAAVEPKQRKELSGLLAPDFKKLLKLDQLGQFGGELAEALRKEIGDTTHQFILGNQRQAREERMPAPMEVTAREHVGLGFVGGPQTKLIDVAQAQHRTQLDQLRMLEKLVSLAGPSKSSARAGGRDWADSYESEGRWG